MTAKKRSFLQGRVRNNICHLTLSKKEKLKTGGKKQSAMNKGNAITIQFMPILLCFGLRISKEKNI